jgi:hypothetical protein
MTTRRIGGRVAIRVGGKVIDAPGEFTFRLGQPVREAALGPAGPVGYLEEPGTAMIEGDVYFLAVEDIDALIYGDDQTVQIDLATGVQFVLEGAWFSGEGEFSTTDGTVAAQWTGRQGRIVR